MMNKNILTAALMSKFNDDNLHAIADETFIRALPFTKKEMSNEIVTGLSTYSKTVINAIGGFNMVLESMNNSSLSEPSKLLVKRIHSICTEAAEAATAEVMKDINLKTEDRTVDEIVESAEVPDAVHEDFVEKAQSLELNNIADIIRNKTISVIKSEKEAYAEDERLEQELKDAVVPETEDMTEEGKDAAVESFISMAVDKHLPRKHISLFSKLQSVALESVIAGKERSSTIPFKTLTNMTLNSTLDIFKNKQDPMIAMENMLDYAFECDVSSEDAAKCEEQSLICTITLFTLLETLSTMNLHSVSKDTLRKFIDTPSNVKDNITISKQKIYDTILSNIAKFKAEIVKSNDIELINTLITKVDNIKTNIMDFMREDVKAAISDIYDAAKNRIKFIEDSSAHKTEFNKFELRDKEETVAQFNKIHQMFANNPNISEIRLVMNKENPDTEVINVNGVGPKGDKVGSTFVPIKYKPAFGSYLGYVKESIGNSKLSSSDKSVCIYYDNGRDKEVIK